MVSDLNNMIDKVISREKVLGDVRELLAECGWELEIAGSKVKISADTDLRVQTRAYVLSDAPDVFLADHYLDFG